MKFLTLYAIIILCAVAYADSDAIGILAGTQEPLSLALYNSTGGLDAGGSCLIAIYDSNALMINFSSMSNTGDGLYSYVWSVPEESGTYRILMGCESSEGLNYSTGGAVYVSPRSFEKTVANGVVKYSDKYEEQYGQVPKVQADNQVPYLNIGLGVGLLIVIVLLGYVAYKSSRR